MTTVFEFVTFQLFLSVFKWYLTTIVKIVINKLIGNLNNIV